MNEIVLNTIDESKVSFVGELVCKSAGVVEMCDGFNRQFALRLFANESGGFVPAIEYTSDNPNEKTGFVAEIVDLLKDVENFFFVFVADDLLQKQKPVERDQIEARRKLETKLRATYECLSSKFLEDVSQKLDSNSELEPTDANGASAEP